MLAFMDHYYYNLLTLLILGIHRAAPFLILLDLLYNLQMDSSNKKINITSRGIIIHNDKMLVVTIVGNGFYCLAGGKIENEENLVECAERELLEELGVKPEIGRLMYVNTFFDKNNVKNMDFIFEVKNSKDYLDLENVKSTHAFELSETCWKDRDEDVNFLPKKIFEDFKEGNLPTGDVIFIRE